MGYNHFDIFSKASATHKCLADFPHKPGQQRQPVTYKYVKQSKPKGLPLNPSLADKIVIQIHLQTMSVSQHQLTQRGGGSSPTSAEYKQQKK